MSMFHQTLESNLKCLRNDLQHLSAEADSRLLALALKQLEANAASILELVGRERDADEKPKL